MCLMHKSHNIKWHKHVYHKAYVAQENYKTKHTIDEKYQLLTI